MVEWMRWVEWYCWYCSFYCCCGCRCSSGRLSACVRCDEWVCRFGWVVVVQKSGEFEEWMDRFGSSLLSFIRLNLSLLITLTSHFLNWLADSLALMRFKRIGSDSCWNWHTDVIFAHLNTTNETRLLLYLHTTYDHITRRSKQPLVNSMHLHHHTHH